MNILVVDNYDSFVWNVVALLRESEPACRLTVVKNDEVDLALTDDYDCILLSPGPGVPSEAGLMPEIIRRCADTHSILGICLGHQAIAECFGARLEQLQAPLHGLRARGDGRADQIRKADQKDRARRTAGKRRQKRKLTPVSV